MENTKPFYLRLLTNELERRKRVNSNYSLRSFARFLELDSGVLSAVLKNKRKLPKHKIKYICDRLKLEASDKDYFIASLVDSKKTRNKLLNSEVQSMWQLKDATLIEENELTKKILSEWEYFTVLSLIDTKEFRNDCQWMAQRLGTSVERMKVVVQNLKLIGLIEMSSSGHLKKLKKNVTTSSGINSQALKQSHKEGLVKALEKIESVPLEQRSFSSMTVAFNPKNIEKARDLIRDFRRSFSAIMEEEQGTEVYQMAIQFFPLTKIENENE